MTQPLSPNEQGLARRLVGLRSAQERPVIEGGGLLVDVFNLVSMRGSVLVIRAALLVFIAYFAWTYYAKAMQLTSEVQAAAAEAQKLEVEAAAQTQKVDAEVALTATLRAELNKVLADADAERARTEALGQNVDGATAKLKLLQAELDKAKAERDKAQAELDAQTQLTPEGISVAKARAQAELAKLESDLARKLQEVRNGLQAAARIAKDPVLNLLAPRSN